MQGITTQAGSEPRTPQIRIDGHQIEKLGFKKILGSLEITADHVTTAENLKPHSLIFLSEKSSLPAFEFAAILVVEKGLAASLSAKAALVFECDRVKDAMVKILPLFDRRHQASGPAISPHCFVSATAKLGANVRVLAGAVIEDGARVGDGCWIGSNAVIEQNAVLGKNCQIHSGAVIGHHCVLGNGCIVHSNTTIGSDGFGFIQSTKGPQIKVPQVGHVEVGDSVEFGGNCSVDRATIGSTKIGEGCKFDNLCHVAHNCKIGPHGLFAGGFFIAGSSEVGSYFACGGNVVIADHIKVCDHVHLGGLSAVTKDITKSGAYTGFPLEPLNNGLKTLASLRGLTEMRRDLTEIKKHLGLKDKP